MCDAHLCLYDKRRKRCGGLQVSTNEEACAFPKAIIVETGDRRTVSPSLPQVATAGAVPNGFPADEEVLELGSVCLQTIP